MNSNLGILLFCAACFGMAAVVTYFDIVWNWKDVHQQPKDDTKPLYPIERPQNDQAA